MQYKLRRIMRNITIHIKDIALSMCIIGFIIHALIAIISVFKYPLYNDMAAYWYTVMDMPYVAIPGLILLIAGAILMQLD